MEKIENPGINLLTDVPVDSDNFGGHDRVASSIAQLIQTEIGGKAIALTGHWGSGKSSIVKMIQKKLGEYGYVFVFDAWAHESDPLRRSFLEKIILFFKEKDLIDNKKLLEDKLDELAKRKETIRTREVKTPTIYGLVLLFITTLIPLAFFFLNDWPKISWPILLISIGVIVLPAVISLLAIISVIFVRNENNKKNIFRLLSTDADVTVDTDTFRTIDPTTIEFQNYFFEIMNEAFKNLKGKKILIVMDNLDRIESDDAMKMWATMRTFFEFDSLKEQNWIDNTWLLVPYDFCGLKNLWGNEKDTMNEASNSKEIPLIHSFTDKTFQISFETPLLVSSDTFEYFKKLINKALPDFKETDEILRLYNVFKYLREPKILPPTPRELILFINNLTAIHRQNIYRKEIIPLHVLGIYVIKRKGDWNDDGILIKELQNFNLMIVDDSLTNQSDSELREYLAALYFNTEIENALQLLLSEKIENAINIANEKYFDEIGTSKGISIIYNDIIRKGYIGWSSAQPNILGNAAFMLSSLRVEEDESITSAWNFIYEGVKKVEKWTVIDRKSAMGISALLKKFEDDTLVEKIVSSFSNSSELFDEHKKVKETIQVTSKDEKQLLNITEAVLTVLNTISIAGKQNIIHEKFRINSQPGTYLRIIKFVMNSALNELAEYCLLVRDSEKIIPYLTENINTGMIGDISWYSTIKQLYQSYSTIDWIDLINNIDLRLQDLNKPTSEQVELLIHVLYLIKENNAIVEEKIKNLTITGFLPHHLQKANSEKKTKTIANCLLCISDYALKGTINTNTGESANGMIMYNEIMKNPEESLDIIEEFLRLLIEFHRMDQMFSIRNVQEKFSDSLIKLISIDKDFTSLIGPNKFLEKEMDFYNSLNHEEYLSVVKKNVVETDLVNILIQEEFQVDLASLYAAIIDSNELKSEEFVEYLNFNLGKMNLEAWLKEYDKKNDNCFDLLITLTEHSYKPNLKSEFKSVLIDFINKVQKKEIEPEHLKANWSKYLSVLDDDNKASFMAHIKHIIIHENTDFSKLIILFENIIIDCDLFKDDIGNLINIGFNSLLGRENEIELNWMLSMISSCRGKIDWHSSSYMNSLKDRIKNRLISMDENEAKKEAVNQILHQIASTLNIDLENN